MAAGGEVVTAVGSGAVASVGSWSRRGLELHDATSFEEWRAVGGQLRTVEQAVMWWIGDWLRFGEFKYGETYSQAVEETGYSRQTLFNAKYVAERFPDLSSREEGLSFYHHLAVASLPETERYATLRDAREGGWSVAHTREEAQRRKGAIPGAQYEPEGPFGYALRCLTRLVAAVFDMDPASFVGEGKGAPAQVHARQVLFYLLNTEAGFDQVTIADSLGRHRSTVWHSVQVVAAMRDEEEIDATLTRLGEFYRELQHARETVPQLIEALAA